MRKTPRALTKILRDARVGNPAEQPVFRAEAEDKKLRFFGFVEIDGTEYECATPAGRIARFPDIDAMVKYLAGCVETATGDYSITIGTDILLVKSQPNDLVAWAADEVVRLGVKKTAQQAVVTGIDAQLALMVDWENTGNALQRAKKLEVQAQKAAVLEDIAAIDAEIVRLTP